MSNKYFKYGISLFIGVIVVVSLFYTYDQYIDKENDTPVKIYKYTEPKSVEKAKQVVSEKEQVSSKTGGNEIVSISNSDNYEEQNQSTDISDEIMELQTVLNKSQNSPLNEEEVNQNDTKSVDTDNVNPNLDPVSKALNRLSAAEPGTKERYDALDNFIDELSVSDNPELRRFSSLIPREVNGEQLTMWELNQRHLKRTQGKTESSDE